MTADFERHGICADCAYNCESNCMYCTNCFICDYQQKCTNCEDASNFVGKNISPKRKIVNSFQYARDYEKPDRENIIKVTTLLGIEIGNTNDKI